MPETLAPTIEKELTGEEERKENHRAMNKILEMFGTEKARENFLDLLEKYRQKYLEQKLSSPRAYTESEKGRAALHNQVMETFQRLSLTAQPNSEEEKILRELADRERTHEVIRDYFEVSREKPEMTKLGKMRLGKFEKD
ncbi:MAG TPA: hypothetical protein ENI16_00405 [Candidatus Portnoybacteria bacterium]|nr:hypothetical protein [Candidatus Portnoybacteria bacterium]